jgi:hypothetical protein
MANYNDERNDLKMNSNMKFLKSLGRNIKNIFVGSHRGEDFILENLEKTDKQSEKAEENPRPEEEIADDWFPSVGEYLPENGSPSWEDTAPSEYEPPDEEITMHEKMYRMATARYNPFSLGGSENCDSDVSCNNLGGSENRL